MPTKPDYLWLKKAIKRYGIHCVCTRSSSSGMNHKYTVLTVVKFSPTDKAKITDITYTVKTIIGDKTSGDVLVSGCGFNHAQHIADQLRWKLGLKKVSYSS